jgi:NAD(P)-dependent dehydrogenase (short-subunit alcohol dehydrogenase family)
VNFAFDRVFDLTGQITFITGGATGIGKAIATLFAERGATLALVDRSDGRRRQLAVRGAVCRASPRLREAAAIATVAQVIQDFGKIVA